VQVLLTLRGRPPNIVVALLGLPGGGPEDEQGDGLSAGADNVAQLGSG